MQLRFKVLLDITSISPAKLTYRRIQRIFRCLKYELITIVRLECCKSTNYELSIDADITETPITDYNRLCTGVKNVSLQKVNTAVVVINHEEESRQYPRWSGDTRTRSPSRSTGWPCLVWRSVICVQKDWPHRPRLWGGGLHWCGHASAAGFSSDIDRSLQI